MSEPRDNDDSEQEIPELSDGEEIDEETEDDDFRSLIENPIEDPGSHLQAEGPGGGMLQQITPPGDEIPLDSQSGAIVPASEDQMGNHGEPDVEVKQERDSGNVELYNGRRLLGTDVKVVHTVDNQLAVTKLQPERTGGESPATMEASNQSHAFSPNFLEGDDSGSEEDISAFMKELERFHKEKSLEFKPPKFYGIGLNCLKLWRAVTRLGGYEQVTSCKLWRQVGESFRPPKTCTTVSWTFRIFYEKALLEYEKHKILTGELHIPISSIPETLIAEKKIGGNQPSGSGRARRDAAARAMQGWHSQRLLGNGEVGDPIIKDKNSSSLLRRDKYLKGSLKRKKASSLEHAAKFARSKFVKPQGDSMVVDIGEPADWVKINVRPTKDCFEVYALVPGLLREEVHVQSDPGGRLIISGEPEQHDNPWGVTPFKKVITLPSRIDPHQTSAVVTLHGQLFVRAPFEQSDI